MFLDRPVSLFRILGPSTLTFLDSPLLSFDSSGPYFYPNDLSFGPLTFGPSTLNLTLENPGAERTRLFWNRGVDMDTDFF